MKSQRKPLTPSVKIITHTKIILTVNRLFNKKQTVRVSGWEMDYNNLTNSIRILRMILS